MMTSVRTAAVSAARGTIGSLEFEILDLDPDVTALIAEVDAILCAALTPARRPPAPEKSDPVTRRSATMRASATRAGRATQPAGPRPTRRRRSLSD